ncbi:MAG: FAD-dependent oxidoreductase [Planctomycetales bacterium]
MGAKTALLTMSCDTVAAMSCNPAIVGRRRADCPGDRRAGRVDGAGDR